MATIPNRQINCRKKSNKKSVVLLKVVFLIIVPKNKFSFEKEMYLKMQFTGKFYHELFTDELSKRLKTRYPLNPLQLLLKMMLGGNVGIEGNNMLLADLAILFRPFGFLAP
jgi:hypothetical protein